MARKLEKKKEYTDQCSWLMVNDVVYHGEPLEAKFMDMMFGSRELSVISMEFEMMRRSRSGHNLKFLQYACSQKGVPQFKTRKQGDWKLYYQLTVG